MLHILLQTYEGEDNSVRISYRYLRSYSPIHQSFIGKYLVRRRLVHQCALRTSNYTRQTRRKALKLQCGANLQGGLAGGAECTSAL